MHPWLRIVVIGAVSLLAFNVVASFASQFTGIPYSYAVIGPVVPPEPLGDDPIRTFAVVVTVALVVASAVAIGAVGGMIGRRQLA